MEGQFEDLQSSLLTSCENLVAIRQAKEAAQVELLRIETDCAMEGVDAGALRSRLGDATGVRALLAVITNSVVKADWRLRCRCRRNGKWHFKQLLGSVIARPSRNFEFHYSVGSALQNGE